MFWRGMWAGTTAGRERTAFGMAGSILLLQVLRWAYGGPNPLVAKWWGTLFSGIIPGICSALLVLCEDLAESEGEQLQSSLEEDKDIELDHIESVSSDEGDSLRFKKLEVSVAGRGSNGQQGRNDSRANLGRLTAVVYSSVNPNYLDEISTSGTGSNREELELVEVKSKLCASELVLNSD